jgi:hypothetical protein
LRSLAAPATVPVTMMARMTSIWRRVSIQNHQLRNEAGSWYCLLKPTLGQE